MIREKLKYCISELAIFLVLMFASSCSDDPVKPVDNTYHFDSARYTWQADTIEGLSYGIWAADTDYVCLQGYGSLIIYDGKNYVSVPYNQLSCTYNIITGIDRNNIFLGGEDVSSANYRKPKFSKWNGNSFEDFIVNDTANPRGYILSITPVSPNEIWLGTNNGRIYKYNGAVFEPFYFDTNLAIRPFFKDTVQDMFFCGTRYYGNIWNPDSHYVEIRKLVNNEWVTVYSKNFSNTEYALIPRNVFNGIYALRFSDINEFVGSTFIKVLNIEPFELMYSADGNSINDFICWGTDGRSVKLYSWNGIKWSDENIYHENLETGMTKVNNYVFATVNDDIATGQTYIYKTKLERR